MSLPEVEGGAILCVGVGVGVGVHLHKLPRSGHHTHPQGLKPTVPVPIGLTNGSVRRITSGTDFTLG
jgi:hypothetical protein